jgi:hypothetical protein
MIVVVVTAPVSIEIAPSFAIPMVIVLNPAAVALPVAFKEALPVVMRPYPARAHVRRTSPVTGVPPVVAAEGIPITIHPDVTLTRANRADTEHSRRRRRPDPHSDGNLSAEYRTAE